MTEFRTSAGSLPHIPDDQSIPQFIFATKDSIQPVRPHGSPWLIEDHSGRSVCEAELSQQTRGLANSIHLKWNINTGDTVCIFSPNNIGYPVCIWAVHSLGGIVTTANPEYKTEELVHQLRITKTALLIIHPAFLSTAQAAAREVGLPEDRIVFIETPLQRPSASHHPTLDELVEYGLSVPIAFTEPRFKPGEAKTAIAFLAFSSGTTGKPKAVVIPHYAVIAIIIQVALHHNLLDDSAQRGKRVLPGDVAIAVLPFYHSYGLIIVLHFFLFAGTSIVVVPKFNFTAFLNSIVRHRITHLLVVPPQVVLLCKHPSVKNYDFSHVKYCISGAAPLSGELVQSLRTVLPNSMIGQGYGLTESGVAIAMLPPTQQIGTVGSVGSLLPGIVARVVKPDGSLASEGEQGELVVTGPAMALGYMDDDAATKETFINGWVHTGDEVIYKDGELYVIDRLKELIKVRGAQVAPAELEGHLLMHPDVADACVVSVLDDYSGELPLAYVVPSDAAMRRIAGDAQAAAQLKAVLAKHVADTKVYYKHLAGGIEFIEAIPKNPSGKILRRVLRDQARRPKVGNSGDRVKL